MVAAGAVVTKDVPLTCNSQRVDLTLFSVEEHNLPIYLQMRRMPLCDSKPWPGEPLRRDSEETARSHVILPLT